jgi:hypothetical protein
MDDKDEKEHKSNKRKKKLDYSKMYDSLMWFYRHINPCQWKDGKCYRMRLIGGESCCMHPKCKYLGQNGCRVKSLSCKSWLCEQVYTNLKESKNEAIPAFLFYQQEVLRFCRETDIELRYRRSMSETFKETRSCV